MRFKQFLWGALIFGCSAAALSAHAMRSGGSSDALDDTADASRASGSDIHSNPDETRTGSPTSSVGADEMDEDEDSLPSFSFSIVFEPYQNRGPSAFEKYGKLPYRISSQTRDFRAHLYNPSQRWTEADFAFHAANLGDFVHFKRIVEAEGVEVLTTKGRDFNKMPVSAAVQYPDLLDYVIRLAPQALEARDADGRNAAFHVLDVESLQSIVTHAPNGLQNLHAVDRDHATLAHAFANNERYALLQYVVGTAPLGTRLLEIVTKNESRLAFSMMRDTNGTPGHRAIANAALEPLKYILTHVPGGATSLEGRAMAWATEYCLQNLQHGFDVLAYLATLPNRRALLETCQGASKTLFQAVIERNEADEELNPLRESLAMLRDHLQTMTVLTVEQKTDLDAGKTVPLTDAQQADAAVFHLTTGIWALDDVVIEMSQKLFSAKYPTPISELRAQWKKKREEQIARDEWERNV